MATVETASTSAALDSEALRELREGFRGEIIEPDHARYDDARVVFNGMFDRRPALILRPTGTADVIRALGLVKASGLPFAVRGGGHSVAGFSSVDGGIVLDLSALAGVRVDPEKRTARAQGGVNWGAFDRETQQFGLAVTGGRVTTTGVAGFTTGSGSGWLERKYGFACDNLISADVVTADGEVVVANERENADLFWGLKGGGGNFGVITELEFNLHPAGPIVYGGLAAFDPTKGRQVINTWRDLCEGAPAELGWAVASIVAPPEPFVPEQWHGKRMWAIAGQFAGPQDQAEQVLAPMRALGPEVDLFQPMPYTVVQGLIDGANPYGRRNYWRAHNVSNFDDKLTDMLLEQSETMLSPFSALLVVNMAGAIADVGDDETALGGRAAPFSIHLNTMWEDADADEANIGWTRGATKAFSPWISPGMALNFYTEVGEDEISDSFGARLGRLKTLKRQYDPGNLFRLNQNIKP
jgi:FAD/FMN-containing dehydrogenase